jgi:hypothetical protein
VATLTGSGGNLQLEWVAIFTGIRRLGLLCHSNWNGMQVSAKLRGERKLIPSYISSATVALLFVPLFVPLFLGKTWREKVLWSLTCLFLSYLGLALFFFTRAKQD